MKREIAKLQRIRADERSMPEPQQELVDDILDLLERYAVEGADRALMGRRAKALASAMEFFASCQIPGGDMRIRPDIEHAARMEPLRQIREKAGEILQLLRDPDIATTALADPRHSETANELYRVAVLVEGGLDRSAARHADAMSAKPGDPKRSRYRLYVEVIGAWCCCKKTSSVPPRKVNDAREPTGEYHAFLEQIFSLTPGTQLYVSPDEAHKAMLAMERNEAACSSDEMPYPEVVPPVPNI